MAHDSSFLRTGAAFSPVQMVVASHVVDYAITPVTAGDDVLLWEIPKGTFIAAVWAEIIRKEGSTMTFDVGDTQAGHDDYIDGADGDVAAGTIYNGDGSTGGTLTTTVHSLYSTSGKYLTLTPVNAGTTGAIKVYWMYADPTGTPDVA